MTEASRGVRVRASERDTARRLRSSAFGAGEWLCWYTAPRSTMLHPRGPIRARRALRNARAWIRPHVFSARFKACEWGATGTTMMPAASQKARTSAVMIASPWPCRTISEPKSQRSTERRPPGTV